MSTWGILLAAGSSTRMAGAVPDKVLAHLAGRPILTFSLNAMAKARTFDGIIVSYRDSHQMLRMIAVAATVPHLPTLGWAEGGETRADSVANALAVIPSGVTSVVIHDAARPFATADAFRTLATRAADNQCATLARRVTDTIKRVDAEDARAVPPFPTRLEDMERKRLWAMETPQAFPLATLREAYAKRSPQTSWTDDTAAVAALGEAVTLVELATPNPKITTPEDLDYAEWRLERERDERA